MTQKPTIQTVEPGLYQHFKGGRYEVVATATHSETQEPMVVYKALYGDFGLWVRPLAMFCETVEQEGESVPRFKPLIESIENTTAGS